MSDNYQLSLSRPPTRAGKQRVISCLIEVRMPRLVQGPLLASNIFMPWRDLNCSDLSVLRSCCWGDVTSCSFVNLYKSARHTPDVRQFSIVLQVSGKPKARSLITKSNIQLLTSPSFPDAKVLCSVFLTITTLLSPL